MKVTLLGDSIRLIGYGPQIPKLLGVDYHVYQPDDNCRYSKFTLRGILWEWKEDISGSDIIHWNNGLWDSCDLGDGPFANLEEYKQTVLRIAKRLLEVGKIVIFATTTPVTDANLHNNNATIAAYNEAVIPELMKMGVRINDLYSLVAANIPENILPDNIHLTDKGIAACATQVAQMILEAAEELK